MDFEDIILSMTQAIGQFTESLGRIEADFSRLGSQEKSKKPNSRKMAGHAKKPWNLLMKIPLRQITTRQLHTRFI